MSVDSPLFQYFAQFSPQIPVLLVSVAGMIALRMRRPPGAPWAMLGFGLTGFLSLASPVAQVLAISWMRSEGVSRSAWIFTALGLVTSALHAAALGLLLTALLAPPRNAVGEPGPMR